MSETTTSQPSKPSVDALPNSGRVRFNPLDPVFHQNPYPTYRQLRLADPVHWSPLGIWVLTAYEDVQQVLEDPSFQADPVPHRIAAKSEYLKERHQLGLDALVQNSQRFLFYLNPPDHTRMRRLVGRAFYWSPERLEQLVAETIEQLLQPSLAQGQLDVIEGLAAPLPVMVIARMLGVPKQDCLSLKPWADELSHILDPLMPLEAYKCLNRMVEQFTVYFEDLISERQKRPQDDAISALLAVGEQNISREELVSICIVLFMTGEETTVNTIGNSLLTLLQRPAQIETLRQNPDRIPAALEELLRFESPLQATARVATKQVSLREKSIEPGQIVLLSLGAANRDPHQFPAPNTLDFQRLGASSHLAFGEGIHYCLGAGLARIQGRLALARLLSLPELQLATDTLKWRKNIALRGVESLPVTFTPDST